MRCASVDGGINELSKALDEFQKRRGSAREAANASSENVFNTGLWRNAWTRMSVERSERAWRTQCTTRKISQKCAGQRARARRREMDEEGSKIDGETSQGGHRRVW